MYFLNVLCFTLGTQISTHIHVNFSPTDLLFRITERILEVISPSVCVCVGFSPLLFQCNSCNHDLSLSKCVCAVCRKCREPAQFSPARIPRLLLNCVRNIFERHSNTHTHAERDQQQMYRLIQKRTWPYLCLNSVDYIALSFQGQQSSLDFTYFDTQLSICM
jgi:hypothetical protein